MRNRAKCKLCNSIIESYSLEDYVTCSCGEIAITGGNSKYYVSAKEYSNFLRVDDEGNEIIVTVKHEDESYPPKEEESIIDKRRLSLDMLYAMAKSYDNLPPQALQLPASNADLASALFIIYSILNSKDS